MASTFTYLAPYEGNDMISFMMEHDGFDLAPKWGAIRSITNVRDIAIIVAEHAILRAKPCDATGFCIQIEVGSPDG